MQILSRYIFREIVSYFTICLLTFTALIFAARILKFTNLIVNKGVEFTQVLKVFLSIIPTFLEIALPMSVLLGVMLAFARLSGDSEIVVMRASGIKITRLLRPVILFGVLVVGAGYYLSIELRPLGYRTLNQTLYDIARSRSVAGITAGMFNSLGEIDIYAEAIDYETGALEKVMLDDRRNLEERKTIFAQKGRIVPLSGSQQIMIEFEEGAVHEKPSGEYLVTNFTSNQMLLSTADVYGDVSLKKDKRGRELSLSGVTAEIDSLQFATEDGDLTRLHRLELERALRFALPWACLLMAVFAVPLGIMPPRAQKTWGASLSLAIGLLCFIVYFGILTVAMAMGESGVLPAKVAVWIPNLVLAVVCFYVFRKVANEQWQSIVYRRS